MFTPRSPAFLAIAALGILCGPDVARGYRLAERLDVGVDILQMRLRNGWLVISGDDGKLHVIDLRKAYKIVSTYPAPGMATFEALAEGTGTPDAIVYRNTTHQVVISDYQEMTYAVETLELPPLLAGSTAAAACPHSTHGRGGHTVFLQADERSLFSLQSGDAHIAQQLTSLTPIPVAPLGSACHPLAFEAPNLVVGQSKVLRLKQVASVWMPKGDALALNPGENAIAFSFFTNTHYVMATSETLSVYDVSNEALPPQLVGPIHRLTPGDSIVAMSGSTDEEFIGTVEYHSGVATLVVYHVVPQSLNLEEKGRWTLEGSPNPPQIRGVVLRENVAILAYGSLVVAVYIGPETAVPPTPAPETQAPATDAPQTGSPATAVPETGAPATDSPQTEAPGTAWRDTAAPATGSPPTEAPATEAPPTPAPATAAPPTAVPPTPSPDTSAPAAGPTLAPAAPTLSPVIMPPPTVPPATAAPLSGSPATPSPATPAPATLAPLAATAMSVDAASVQTDTRTVGTAVAGAVGVMSILGGASGSSVPGQELIIGGIECTDDTDESEDLELVSHPLMFRINGVPQAGAIVGNISLSIAGCVFFWLLFRAVSRLGYGTRCDGAPGTPAAREGGDGGDPGCSVGALAPPDLDIRSSNTGNSFNPPCGVAGVRQHPNPLCANSGGGGSAAPSALKRAQAVIRYPSVCLPPILFLFPGTLESAFDLIFYPRGGPAVLAIGIMGLLACTGLTAALWWTSKPPAAQTKPVEGVSRVASYFFGSVEWVSDDAHRLHVERHGVTFDIYRNIGWIRGKYFALEMAILIPLSLIVSIRTGVWGWCIAKVLTLASLMAGYIALCLACDIFIARFLKHLNVALHGFMILGLIFHAVAFANHSMQHWGVEVGVYFFLMGMICSLIRAVYDFVTFGLDMWNGFRTTERRAKPAHATPISFAPPPPRGDGGSSYGDPDVALGNSPEDFDLASPEDEGLLLEDYHIAAKKLLGSGEAASGTGGESGNRSAPLLSHAAIPASTFGASAELLPRKRRNSVGSTGSGAERIGLKASFANNMSFAGSEADLGGSGGDGGGSQSGTAPPAGRTMAAPRGGRRSATPSRFNAVPPRSRSRSESVASTDGVCLPGSVYGVSHELLPVGVSKPPPSAVGTAEPPRPPGLPTSPLTGGGGGRGGQVASPMPKKKPGRGRASSGAVPGPIEGVGVAAAAPAPLGSLPL